MAFKAITREDEKSGPQLVSIPPPFSRDKDSAPIKETNMDIDTSYNFRGINERLTTSGVVPPDRLKALASQGYEVVINLMPDTSEYAVADERKIVESQNLEYIYIPVDFQQPTRSDFTEFSEAMDRVSRRKVHIHCAANYRVSAFYALYAAIRGYWSVDRAWAFIQDVWQPAEHSGWPEFIEDVFSMTSEI